MIMKEEEPEKQKGNEDEVEPCTVTRSTRGVSTELQTLRH